MAQHKRRRISLSLHVAASPSETCVFLGTGAGQSVVDRVPLVILRRKGREAFFACLLEPRRTEKPSSIQGLTAIQENGLWLIDVRTPAGRFGFTWDGDGKLEAKAGR